MNNKKILNFSKQERPEHKWRKFVNWDKIPTVYCPGCSLGILFRHICQAFSALNYTLENTVVISGIGCTARMSGYFNLDSVNALHGRAIPIAEGIKYTNPELNVVVVSGDGDLAAIGGNHLIHSSQRDSDITVICADNRIYGLTGGQCSPTTRKGVYTITTPRGKQFPSFNIQGVVTASRRYLFGRSTTAHQKHLGKVLREALTRKGFSFVQVRTACIENMGRRLGFNTTEAMFKSFRKNFKIAREENKTLAQNELGVMKSE